MITASFQQSSTPILPARTEVQTGCTERLRLFETAKTRRSENAKSTGGINTETQRETTWKGERLGRLPHMIVFLVPSASVSPCLCGEFRRICALSRPLRDNRAP